jgi:hypothetical protein
MKHRLILIAISLVVFGLVLGATNSFAGSDPKFTLLVSQSLVDNKTIRLDAYRDDLLLREPVQTHINTGNLFEQDGHLYNFFPTGPSILTLPIVAVMRQTGMDMRLVEDNTLLQKVLAGLTSVLMVWIIYSISRCFLDETSSLVISAASVFGTSFISTMGTAFWTINLSTIFIGVSVLLITRYESGKTQTVRPIILGLLLFLAYFSRASSAAFIIVVMGYLFVKERRQFLITAATSLFLLLIFLIWTRLEFGVWLPAYYWAGRIADDHGPVWTGLLGNLVSPSRGILVLSPFLLLIIPGILFVGRLLIRQPLVWMAASWFLISLLINSKAVAWWDGVFFGPRLLTESLLALILLVILIWSAARERLGKLARRIVISAFVILSLAAIYIHSIQGLYNADAVGWNLFIEPRALPPISGLGDLFDWKNPQFMATNKRNCDFNDQRFQELLPYDTTLEEYLWGDPIRHTADQIQDFREATIVEAESRLTPMPQPEATSVLTESTPQVFLPSIMKPGNLSIFIGWQGYKSQLDYRRSICPEVRFVFRLGQIDASGSFELAITAGALDEQEVRVSVNGTMVGSFVNTSPVDQPDRFTIPFDGTLLKSEDLNEINLELPDAKRPRPGAYQYLSLTFYQAAVYPEDQAPGWVTAPQPTPAPQGYP